MSKTELTFSEILNKSINNTKAKTFKIANKYENINQAKQEVLAILDSQRNIDGYIKEYKENFIICINGIKYNICNDKKYLTKNEKNQELKKLYLSSICGKGKVISIAELINKYNKNAVRFLSHKNTRFGDIYTEIVL